eukprot:2645355-Pleurochrysis_carterae.AAC.1
MPSATPAGATSPAVCRPPADRPRPASPPSLSARPPPGARLRLRRPAAPTSGPGPTVPCPAGGARARPPGGRARSP